MAEMIYNSAIYLSAYFLMRVRDISVITASEKRLPRLFLYPLSSDWRL